MCETVVTPDGAWLHSANELESAGIPVPGVFIDDWDRDACLCGVDVEGVLEAAGRAYTVDIPGFYDLVAT